MNRYKFIGFLILVLAGFVLMESSEWPPHVHYHLDGLAGSESLFRNALESMLSGELERATSFLQQVQKMNPSSVEVLIHIAVAHCALNEPDQYFLGIERILQMIDPNSNLDESEEPEGSFSFIDYLRNTMHQKDSGLCCPLPLIYPVETIVNEEMSEKGDECK